MNPTKIKNKEQFVVAMIDDFDHVETVMSHALFLAKMIDKGLIMLHICDGRHALSTEEAETRMKALQQRFAHEGAITYCVLKSNTKKVIDALPTLLNAVVVVTEVDSHAPHRAPQNPHRVLKLFADCKIAYLTVQEPLRNPLAYKHVFTSIDFKKESKEKLIWTSYFARFYGSQIHVLYYDYKDEGLHRKWYDNMRFLHKFFNNLNLSFTPHIIPQNQSTFTDVNALKAIESGTLLGNNEVENETPTSQDYGLLLSVTTNERDAIEWFVGTQEKRTIVNRMHLPVMYLNPREDLYVLCD